ncbi:hypothetical protein BDV38DRAFT_275180 [Aspergillus pseudotamarii]|uniref:Uncharacterized protein n=1 Tax=Aspergillus pseudotamarii TaxID=132259 RepID=A0A5N6SER3_ASPPS|nr:uncharacterized protein BDV38DRAFT_275180 [Aspergillus pseudotamarii]KAE8132339.1 hypothetical protein BDV38DRAFT_275180 [Aspergillus pseudotamarii]
MAMFVSPTSEYMAGNSSKPNTSESHILSRKIDGQRIIPSTEESPEVDRFAQRRHRKTASVNDADTKVRASRWLGSVVSPASPILPTYPPPVRMPTPPGLPSFGTQEAVRSSARFPVQSAPGNGQFQQRDRCSNAADGNRFESYRESFLRFFGISSSSAFRPNRRGCIAVRAVDNTIVQGRFPHRHSAHGVGANGRLLDHPFHRRNLSMAQCGGIDEGGGGAIQTRPSDTEHCSHIKRQNSIYRDNLPVSRPQYLPSSISPGPSFSVTTQSATTSANYTDRRALEPGARRTPVVDMPAILASEPSGCSLTQTRSTAEPSVMLEGQHGRWLQASKIVNSFFCCCLEARNEQDTIVYVNTTSNDTYATARSRVSDESAAHSHVREGTVQEFRRYCSNMWTSFGAFISSRSHRSSTWLEQTREPF